MSFVHLHAHTEYSLLDASNKIKDYVATVKALGMNACAITDHGVMYGVIDFYKTCLAEGIRPILGCEVYVAPGSRFDKTAPSGAEKRYYHLVLLAENNKGYENLTRIVSRGFTEGFYYKPRVDMELLEKYHEGLICLSACLAGEIPRAITAGDYAEACNAAMRYLDCFGRGNFFLEMQDHGIPAQKQVNQALLKMSAELDIPLVITNDCHYTYDTDVESHDLLLCLQTGKKVTDTDRMRYEGGQYYVKSEEEMRTIFPHVPEAFENTQKIADRCNVEIEFHNTKLPRFDVPEGTDARSYLRKICEEGFALRYPEDDGTVRKQMDYELSVIENMGYVDYFLIVWDFIKWSRDHDVSVGPGRGSAAGSVVSYCMQITNIDPVRYDLLFERFLNPERVSMPDIDVDFEYERRQDVIDYVTEKYGQDSVVQIITFGTMAAKGVVRDVARVLDLPYSFGDQIAKLIPNELNITLSRALKMNPELRRLYRTDETAHRVLEYSMRLEGLPRHSSTHAAGVVICGQPAEELVPLSRGSDGNITTQFTMTTIEELGLLKMDFLGLRTLTVIKDATRFANRAIGASPGDPDYIDIDRIDMNDPKALQLISSGHTDGVFQLESGGMQSFMKELKPQSLEDIIAGISLYRPGPMDYIPKYIAGKNNSANITYQTPELKPILKATYGCIVYQEQVMQIVQQLGGYSLGRADLVRRAMSKKKHDVMEKERANFVDGNPKEGVSGCASLGIPRKAANDIFDSMMDFASYAFNKSHAAAYAVVAMQTAWLKAYFPAEFMAALMTSVIDAPSKLIGYIQDARTMGIPLLSPDVNEGDIGFSVSCAESDGSKAAPPGLPGAPAPQEEHPDAKPDADGRTASIRYALTAIKSVGRSVVEAIVAEREANGRYKDINSFLTRLSSASRESTGKRYIENLIKAGALDSLGGTRKQYMCVYSQILEQLHESKNTFAGQMSLFDIGGEELREQYTVKLPDVGEFDKRMLLEFEKEVLGIYLSGHPLEDDAALLKRHANARTLDFYLDEETGRHAVDFRGRVTIGGIVAARKTKYTKNDKIMAFVTLEDMTGSIEVVVFPKTYELYAETLREDAKVLIEGHVSVEEGQDDKLIAEKVTPFEDIPRTVWIRCSDLDAYKNLEEALFTLLSEEAAPGHDTVNILLADKKQYQTIDPKRYSIRADAELLEQIRALFGEKNVYVL